GNTAVGYNAFGAAGDQGYVMNNNTAIGINALDNLIAGNNNIALGNGAGHSLLHGTNNIEIGNDANGNDNNVIRIGNQGTQTSTIIAGIYGETLPGTTGTTVYVDSGGHLGTMTSSRRFKADIKSMADASDAIYALRPVTFKYNADIDPKGGPEFGLIAEEVAQADPDLVVRDARNQIYTVRYEAVNAMLLNEFLKEHRAVQNQNAEIESLKQKAAKVDSIEKRLRELEQMVQSLAEKK
ncbi:MAG TPA: tail fiber domain-containing protein, partial [Candidatus Saccharimonadales bacterium]|nr:tail fiber domain-containing protein [Candidatus Saccharimonadales bacterium]